MGIGGSPGCGGAGGGGGIGGVESILLVPWGGGSLVSGEMFLAELFPQFLRPVYGQAVVCPVPWVKADDIVVAFHIFPFLVFLIAEISPHTGNSEILAPRS